MLLCRKTHLMNSLGGSKKWTKLTVFFPEQISRPSDIGFLNGFKKALEDITGYLWQKFQEDWWCRSRDFVTTNLKNIEKFTFNTHTLHGFLVHTPAWFIYHASCIAHIWVHYARNLKFCSASAHLVVPSVFIYHCCVSLSSDKFAKNIPNHEKSSKSLGNLRNAQKSFTIRKHPLKCPTLLQPHPHPRNPSKSIQSIEISPTVS